MDTLARRLSPSSEIKRGLFGANSWHKSHTSRPLPANFTGAPTVGVSHPKKEPQAYFETTVCESVPGSACLGCLGCDQGGLQSASLGFCAWACVRVVRRSLLALLGVCELSRHFSPRGRRPSHRVTQADTHGRERIPSGKNSR